MYVECSLTLSSYSPWLLCPASPGLQLVKDGDVGLGQIGITYTPTDCARGVGVVGEATVPAIMPLAPVPEGARRLRAFQQW
jgi:hypothetical protein